MKLFQPGTNTLVMSANPTTSTNGGFTVRDIPAGTYDVEVKHSQSLSRRANRLTFSAGATTSQTLGMLLTGDVNDDNAVNIVDFSLLSASFGKTQGQPGFNARGDLDATNAVDILDFSLLSSNFGRTGPVAVGAP